MENSYDWNPECGVYTERTQFVDAAIDFFDIVWDISAADELSIERLQRFLIENSSRHTTAEILLEGFGYKIQISGVRPQLLRPTRIRVSFPSKSLSQKTSSLAIAHFISL